MKTQFPSHRGIRSSRSGLRGARLRASLLLVLCLALLVPPVPASGQSDWTPIAPGIEFRQFKLTDPPNNVFVARLDRAHPSATLESTMAQGRLASDTWTTKLQTVRGMAEGMRDTLNYWGGTWGGRNRVVVAINGFYWDQVTGTPNSAQIQSGWFAQRFWTDQIVSGIGWTLQHEPYVAEMVTYKGDKNVLTFLDTEGPVTQNINGINRARGEDELILFTHQYDATTRTDDGGVEVLVEMSRPSMILPLPAMAAGTVRQIRSKGSTQIPFDHIVLSAKGAAADKLGYWAKVGVRVGISQEVTESPLTPTKKPFTKTYAGIGADRYILKNGVIDSRYPGYDPSNLTARTAVAFNPQYVYFVVVDGKNPGVSEGMDFYSLAKWTRDALGATDAVTLDGGGSSTMWINGEVVNNTTCNFTDCRTTTQTEAPPTGSLIPSQDPERPLDVAVWNAEGALVQPMVGNAMLMVYSEPRIQSDALPPGTPYTYPHPVQVRLGPGNNYAAIGETLPGEAGEVITHTNGLNGIYATGRYWWKMDFNETPSGWVPVDTGVAEWHRNFLPLLSGSRSSEPAGGALGLFPAYQPWK